MRVFVLFISLFILNGCFIYSSEDDCIYGLTSTQCFGEEYNDVAKYQKKRH